MINSSEQSSDQLIEDKKGKSENNKQSNKQEENFEPEYFCTKCNTLKINKPYHCMDCDVCIDEYDHHCPWIGKVNSND